MKSASQQPNNSQAGPGQVAGGPSTPPGRIAPDMVSGQPGLLPKLCGADLEFGNFFLGVDRPQGTGYHAARLLLRAIDGVASLSSSFHQSQSYNRDEEPESTQAGRVGGRSEPAGYHSQDWGRKYLRNGGCAYVDLNHLELCIPEVISAYDHLACSQAMFRLAHAAATTVNARLPESWNIVVLANNSDGRGNSYGTHLNFLISRQAWEDIFHRRLHFQLFLAAFQASSIVFTGQGKVGSENSQPPVDFQISQRADFFEVLAGPQTTYQRPIVNSRDEALCGEGRWRSPSIHPAAQMARLHVILYDNNLCHTAGFLKVGVLQIILAMIEAGRMNPNLILDNPVEALIRWSHDPNLRATAPLVSGRERTAVELQLEFFEEARRFVESGLCAPAVPFAREILALWGDVLGKLKMGQFAALTPHLDWVLKRSVMEQAMRQRPDLSWASPEIKHLDHLYSDVDPSKGLYWAYERAGLVHRLVTEARIHNFLQEAPEDTRAWTRALLLRVADPADIEFIDWDYLRFKFIHPDDWPGIRRPVLAMANPLWFTRRLTEPTLPESATAEELLEALGARENTASQELTFPSSSAAASTSSYRGTRAARGRTDPWP